MSVWQAVAEEISYGIAIHNFAEDSEHKLQLTLGDAVHILEQEEGWYYGYAIHDRQKQGIFPKTYIHIKKCTVDKSGPLPTFILKEPPIAQEITSVIREWGLQWKNLYVNHSKDFDLIKNQIYDLITHKSKILSGTLPVDELKRLTKQATEEIDMGNKILGLDLVVRDKNGNLINPEETSTMQLYYHHQKATERMIKSTKSGTKETLPKTAIQQYSNIFIVAVKNFTCKMTEDAQLLMTLYDGKEYKSITENYVVQWSKDGLMSDLDQMYNLRVMFTDLGKRDLEREKIFLVCYVVRVGAMETREIDHRRSSMCINQKKNSNDNMRRPFGVAAMEITNFMNGNRESDLDQEFQVPFVNCEKDNLEQTLRKIMSKDFAKMENKNQALFISMKLLRGDLKQVREENPHLVLGNVSIARKMGFPEVILPGDVRNDLYLTLVKGEFTKGNKTSDKNVEVIVKVCNEKGEPIPSVIGQGSGISQLSEYKSVIYYHEDKPHWFETFKVAIPIEEFKLSHLKFTFKHRSSNEVKDKSEKPFAMCYVRLMQENGTTLKDDQHNLVVYKIDSRKFDETSLDYFKLPSTMADLKENGIKQQVPGLAMSTKDSFMISSNICSTKLTQNVDLLGLLNWQTDKNNLTTCLKALINVDGEEVVKFLQDILDSLFSILMMNSDTDTYDILVFECLLHIISLVSNDWKYQHFEPVLDLYIRESFSATLAHKKLISVLKSIIGRFNVETIRAKDALIFKTMKSLQYVIRFVTKSRMLMKLYPVADIEDDFEGSLRDLFHDIIYMMSYTSDSILREQGACLKFLPSTIPDILMVFDAVELSRTLCEMLQTIQPGRLTKQKMMTINEIVHSKLFLRAECRTILLPVFLQQVKSLFEKQEEVELCIKILSDILELLFRKDVGNTSDDLVHIIMTTLRTVIQSHINMQRENPRAGNLVAIMIDIFRQMSGKHYNTYIQHFKTSLDILDFLMEILLVFKNLVGQSVFPPDWCDMIMLQNSVILKALRLFSHTIRDSFFDKFETQAWSNFFHCAIAFMTQPALQLETFSYNKRLNIVKRYNDMRRETGDEILAMWFNLGQHKVQFVPSLVGSILEMTLIPEVELRKSTIPIFFDMMQCEFYSSKYEFESYGDTKRDSRHIKGSFCEFENEMIAKLDILVEGGKGDEDYKDLFHAIMMGRCIQHTTMRDDGTKFVKTVTRLMERLLEYRCIITDENKDNRMSCTVSLLDFYSEINRKEMYIRYLNKLCDLHIECDNYTEAAYTLELHTKLLNWSDEPLPQLLRSNRHLESQTHRQLKEHLYYNIIKNYSDGKMWECAIRKCQELAQQFELETFDYERLSELHKRMAMFYEDIMKKGRPEPEYFRVGYYGKGFPLFLQNKVFVYRGKEYDRLADFNSRVLNDFPKAELLITLTPPGEEITQSEKQYIQINKVDPVMDEKKQRFSGKAISEQIVQFYKVNDIKKFTFSRPFIRKDPHVKSDNEFGHLWLERFELTTTYPLPGILRWFPVSSVNTFEVSPLRHAIETMEQINKKLRNYVVMYNKDKNMSINPLSLTLTGILDAAVMGGIKNYEEAFFTDEYIEHHVEDEVLLKRLQDLIADQLPLLELCVQIHEKGPETLQPLHKRLEERLAIMRESVLEKYGKGSCDIKLDNSQVTMRRHYSVAGDLKLSEMTVRLDKSNSNNHSKSLLTSPSKSVANTPINQKKSFRNPREKRRSNSKPENLLSPTATQWYTSPETAVSTNGSPALIVELTEELTPKRPLRSEVEKEKRLSRPSSGQFSRPNSLNVTIPGSSGNSSNRDSIGTTDSSVSEEDAVPPPLPVKTRDCDYSQLPNNNERASFLYSERNAHRTSLQIITVAQTEQEFFNVPPIPPPKPPKKKNIE